MNGEFEYSLDETTLETVLNHTWYRFISDFKCTPIDK